MTNISSPVDAILFALVEDETITSKEDFHKLKNTILATYKLAEGPAHIELIERFQTLVDEGKIADSLRVRQVLRKRAVRSLSGVSVISLLTKSWGCPGKCIYCPSYEGLPKSYIPNEPAVQRAEMNQFDPFLQVQNRLRSLQITGNAISKCDVRIIGGTWSVYPREYQEEFIRNIYDAHSTFSEVIGNRGQVIGENTDNPFLPTQQPTTNNQQLSSTLDEAKKRNETAESRVIGIAIETRPDWVTEEEISRLRRYGVTRVEIGYQTTHDEVNSLNKRGHGNAESIRATQLLKDAGFKVVAHMMPGLYGSTPELDLASMREIFENSAYRPDELKIYPLVVTPHSELETLWRDGTFTPYDDTTLIPLMAELQGMIPEYVRLNRMYRDIPAGEILAGSKIANLRQVTELQMRKMGITRHDISAREIRAKSNSIENAVLEEYFYEASGGHEWFFQMVDPQDRTLFGLARLRIPSQVFSSEKQFLPVLENAAIIREVHVFGDQIPVSNLLEKGGADEVRGGGGLVLGKKQYISFRPDLEERAKELRKEMTGPEKHIWHNLLQKDKMEGLRFLRQKPLLDYIVDFYCHELRLAIEIDGESHIGNEEYDKRRTEELGKEGIELIRFTNDEVLKNLEGVYEVLKAKVQELQSTNPPDSSQEQTNLPPFSRGYKAGQHQGFGRRMMAICEQKVREFYPDIARIAVISGVGVRGYYEKLGYSLQDEYMVKILTKNN